MFGRWRRDGRSAPLSPRHGAWVLGSCGTQALIRGCRGGDTSHWRSGVCTQHIGTRGWAQVLCLCGHIPSSHRPFSDTTFLCYATPALRTGRTPGEASLFCVVSMMTTPKREEKRSLFPEDGNKPHSAAPQERTEKA